MKVEIQPRPHFFALLVVAVLMFASFLVLVIPRAHAAIGLIVSNTCSADNAVPAASATCNLTVANIGDTVIAEYSFGDGSNAANTVGVSPPASIKAGTVSLSYQQTAFAGPVQGGANCGATNCYGALVASGLAAASGVVAVTVDNTGCSPNNLCYGTLFVQDVTGANGVATAQNTATSTHSDATFFATALASPANSFGQGALLVAAYSGGDAAFFGGGPGFTLLSGPTELAEYSTGNPANPTQYPFTHNRPAVGVSYVEVGAVYGGSSNAVSTTTVNTNCLGACSGGSNGTSIFSLTMPNLFVFQTSQNQAGGSGQVDNFTMKVSSVHITTNTGTVYVVTCMPVVPTTVASGGNQWSCFNAFAVTITNNTSNFFIHANPQTNICASCYYAVGVFATTTASRGSGASGAGIGFFESSQTGVTQYKYAVGSSTPPTTFFSNTVVRPNLFMYIHTTFSVFLTTVTTTLSAVTVTGAITTTISTTVTSTTLDANLAIQGTTMDSILLLIILAPAMLIMLPIAVFTRSPFGAAIGFVVGLMIGAGIGVQSGMVPPVFLGVTLVSAVLMIVGFARTGGHGGV
jgi:hypothetical protein